MIKYKVIRPPLFIEAYHVLEVGAITRRSRLHDKAVYRETTIDSPHGRASVLEWPDAPLKVGDLVRYAPEFEDYTAFDPSNLAEGITLIPIHEGNTHAC